MAANAWVDSFLPQSEKCGNERVKQSVTWSLYNVHIYHLNG